MQTNTLDKIQVLEFLFSQGFRSDYVDQTLDKIISLERNRTRKELAELQNNLSAFEDEYQMSSDDFYGQFQAGTLGDDADFFEWSAVYDMAQSLITRLHKLESLGA
ncbi:MAG: hypothetical protein ISR58_14095 [Anaerolineales bacterium]|nr:hypothetical protein [Chloroflexota bacterium]MBL6982306.1 hypothetical protein [Anaerolineales bacterium]